MIRWLQIKLISRGSTRMNIEKAVITAAGPAQRTLPLQHLIDRDGQERTVLAILIEEAAKASAERTGIARRRARRVVWYRMFL